jgi:hypothetical protein
MSDASPIVVDDQNPWPGLREFPESAERFFNGRAQESIALHRLVMQAPLTVLFGASGLGKTSILQAGLFPLLRPAHCLPIYVRFRITDAAAPLIEQVSGALVGQIRDQHVEGPEWRHRESLWEYLHRTNLELWSTDNYLLTPVFVIDQFEEVFTIGAAHTAAIARLKVDLADFIENRVPDSLAGRMRSDERALDGLELNRQRYKVVLSFREDFLPAVEGLKTAVPSIMRNRLRLLPMSAAQAFDAVHTTAPHLADPPMARRIVAFVAGGDGVSEDGQHDDVVTIEPALLSLVCTGLNKKRREQGKPRFDANLLRGTGQAIVEQFYHDSMRDMPPHVHRFVERELITEMGFRKLCNRDDAQRVHGVENDHIQRLVDRRLLRIEPIRGTDWIELMHDLLTPVVRADREHERVRGERRRRRRVAAAGAALLAVAIITSLLAVYAWLQRARALQLQGAANQAADTLRDTNAQLSETNRKLKEEKAATETANQDLRAARTREGAALDQAQKAREEAQRRAKSEFEAKTLAERGEADAKAAAADALDAKTRAEVEQRRAEQSEREANDAKTIIGTREEQARQASNEAQRLRNLATAQDFASKARLLQRDADQPLAMQLALHAYRLQLANCTSSGSAPSPCPGDATDPNVHSALIATLNRVTATSRRTSFGAGGIVSTTAGGSVMRLVGNVLTSARPGARTTRVEVQGWRGIGIGTEPASVAVSAPADRRMTAVALAPDGFPLVRALMGSNEIEVWDETHRLNEPIGVVFDDPSVYAGSLHASDVLALTFSRDGKLIASANSAGVVLVWRDGRVIKTSIRETGDGRPPAIRSLAFAPTGDAVLIGLGGHGIDTWDLAGDSLVKIAAARGYEEVRPIIFNGDGRRFAFGDKLGVVRIVDWDPRGRSFSSTTAFRDTHLSPVNALAFSPSGRLLASAGADGVIRVFQVARPAEGAIAVLEGHRGGVESLAFADDTVLYSGGVDRTIRIWPLRMDALAWLVCHNRDPKETLPVAAAALLRSMLPPEAGLPRGVPIDACDGVPAPEPDLQPRTGSRPR